MSHWNSTEPLEKIPSSNGKSAQRTTKWPFMVAMASNRKDAKRFIAWKKSQ